MGWDFIILRRWRNIPGRYHRDHPGRLTAYSMVGIPIATYTYDAFRRRVKKNVLGAEILYFYEWKWLWRCIHFK